jgi:hypothetical protein
VDLAHLRLGGGPFQHRLHDPVEALDVARHLPVLALL